MNACPSQAELRQLLEGEPTSGAGVRDHVAACRQCQSQLEAWTSITTHARQAPTAAEPALAEIMEQLRQTPPPAEADQPLLFPGPATPAAPLGRLGPYDIIRQLGGGGGGLLFQARDTKLNRLVALKVLRPELAALPSARQRFEREARAAASLQHPHVVTVHDVAAPPDFLPYLVMEFIDGQSLAELGRVLPPRPAAGLAAQAAEGLSAAHARGLVHRDVKPSNLLLDRSAGRVKVVDFGLALGPDLPQVTHAGQVLGTPAYMSPEQAAGGQVDARSDIYGLGATLYFLLTGRPPFDGNTRQVLQRVLHQEPESPRRWNPDLPRDLETIVMQCLAKEPARRYPSAADLAADLHRFLRGEPVQARPVGRGERLLRWCKRNRALAGTLAAAVVLLIAGAASAIVATVQYQKRQQVGAVVADRERTLADRDRTLAERARRNAERHRLLAQLRLGDENYEWVNYETARDHYRQALKIGEALYQADPADIRSQEDLGRIHEKLGDVHDDLGDIPEAIRHYEKSLELNEQVLRVEPSNQPVKKSVAMVSGTLAEIYDIEEEKPQRVKELFQRADVLLDELVRAAITPESAAELVMRRAELLCLRGRCAEAAAAADHLRRHAENDNYALYCAACCYAKCYAVRGKGPRDEYARLAFEVMREAIAAGFDDVRMFQKDPDWKPLRNHAQFQATVDLIRKTNARR